MRIKSTGTDITTLNQPTITNTAELVYDLPVDKWLELSQYTATFFENENMLTWDCWYAFQLHTLNPTMVAENLKTEEAAEKILKYITSYFIKEINGDDDTVVDPRGLFNAMVFYIRVLKRTLPSEIMAMTANTLSYEIATAKGNSDPYNTAWRLLAGKILFPERNIPLVIDERIFTGSVDELMIVNELRLAAMGRLLYPQIFPQVDTSIYGEHIFELVISRQQQLLEVTWGMNVMFADNVAIDQDGINFGTGKSELVELPVDSIF